MPSHVQSHPYQLAIGMIFFGGGILFHAFDHYRRKMKIDAIGTIPIKSAPQGFVELQGYAWPKDPCTQTSVLSSDKVVYYAIKVEKLVRRGKSSEWVSIFSEQTKEGFLIADPTGIAVLNIESGECDVTLKTRAFKLLSSEEQIRLRTHLSSRKITIETSIFEKYRVTESIIKPGSPICVTGFFSGLMGQAQVQNKVRAAQGLQKFLQHLVIAQKAPLWALQHPIAVGETSSPTPSMETSLEPAICFGIVSSNTGSQEKLFFADCHRAELLSRLSKYLGLKIIGGSLLIALGITILFFYPQGHQ